MIFQRVGTLLLSVTAGFTPWRESTRRQCADGRQTTLTNAVNQLPTEVRHATKQKILDVENDSRPQPAAYVEPVGRTMKAVERYVHLL